MGTKKTKKATVSLACSVCRFSLYMTQFRGYTCKHRDNKDVRLFVGSTKPRSCPLAGGKQYYTDWHKDEMCATG